MLLLLLLLLCSQNFMTIRTNMQVNILCEEVVHIVSEAGPFVSS